MRRLIVGTLGWLVTLGVPILLILGSVRLVMTPQYLSFEYHRPDMTADAYGFTLADRLEYGPVGIEYLLTDADISLLGDLRFENGQPMFTARELHHMVDVKNVTQVAFTLLWVTVLIVPVAAAGMVYLGAGAQLRNTVMRGAIFTLGGIAAIVFGAVVAWDTFFTLFHQLFFADGTWLFYTSDTLIRLYPEKFWFDAAVTIGVIVIGGALVMIAVSYWLWRRAVYASALAKEPA